MTGQSFDRTKATPTDDTLADGRAHKKDKGMRAKKDPLKEQSWSSEEEKKSGKPNRKGKTEATRRGKKTGMREASD